MSGSRVEKLDEKIAALRTRRDRRAQMQAALDQSGEDQISLTDPDSRAMTGMHDPFSQSCVHYEMVLPSTVSPGAATLAFVAIGRYPPNYSILRCRQTVPRNIIGERCVCGVSSFR
jgi:hypothetical protein